MGYFHTLLILAVSVGCFYGARKLAHLNKPFPALATGVPLLLLFALAGATRWPALKTVWGFNLLMQGFTPFALFGPTLATLMGARLKHWDSPIIRNGLIILICVCVFRFSMAPFFFREVSKERLRFIKTTFDKNGICLQNTPYTCGPAAAVTALKLLGHKADEAELAIACNTTAMTGTPTDILCAELNRRYQPQGLTAKLEDFDQLDQIPKDAVVLTTVKYAFMIDHWVTLLNYNENEVAVADPMKGKVIYSRDRFDEIWRKEGVVVRNNLVKNPLFLQP